MALKISLACVKRTWDSLNMLSYLKCLSAARWWTFLYIKQINNLHCTWHRKIEQWGELLGQQVQYCSEINVPKYMWNRRMPMHTYVYASRMPIRIYAYAIWASLLFFSFLYSSLFFQWLVISYFRNRWFMQERSFILQES